jgi:hypothetical protein
VTETTTTPAAPAQHVLASDPLLCWEAIAAHARDHHQHAWPDSDAATEAITSALVAILPDRCDYDPARGTITAPSLPAPPSWAPEWTDTQLLNCVIATLAAATPCYLDEIYDSSTYVIGPRAA